MKNREIKFRAWDKRLSEMLYDVSVYADGMIGLSDIAYRDVVEKKIGRELWDDEIHQFDEEGNTKLIGTVLSGEDWYWLEKDEFELMQYTGLKDKNGKEIYEGDIVRSSTYNYGNVSSGIYKVVYNNGAFTTTSGYGFEYASKDSIEIIGNIYENPELL